MSGAAAGQGGLVGRERELAATDDAIAAVSGGATRVLAVLGETGIGKSALLGALAERATNAGMLVLSGRAAEHERDVPFGLVVDALDDHVATLHPRRIESVGADLAAVLPAAAPSTGPVPAMPGARERFRCHRALRALLEMLGRERPVALLLDDLHWADDASIELVLHLLRRPARVPHLLAFALRPMEPAPRMLHATRAAGGSRLLDLAPLAHEESLELVAHVGDAALRERLAREAAGNPLFLQELARVAREPGGALPPTLLAAVRLEVGAMPDAARALLDGAAVAGDPFDPELAAAAAGLDGDAAAPDRAGSLAPADALAALDQLVAADLVCATGDGRAFRFRHPLLRRAVYDAAPPAWRLAAHERVAAALQARGAGAAVRAFHVEKCARAGDPAAVALLREAAAAAADTAPATAARWYAAGVRLLPHAEREERAALLGPMALALANAGRLHESREALQDVLALLPSERTPDRLALVAQCAGVEHLLGRHGDAHRRLLAALADAPPAGRAALELEMAAAGFYAGDAAAMRDWAARAARDADGQEALRAGAEALGGLGAQRTGDADAAATLMARAIDRLARIDDPEIGAGLGGAVHVATAALLGERFEDGYATLDRALTIARATRQDGFLGRLAITRAQLQRQRLNLDEALADVEVAEEGARLQGVRSTLHHALWTKAIVHLDRGEGTDAERIAAESAELLDELEASTLTRTGRCAVAAIHEEQDAERCIREMTAAGGPMLEGVDETWRTWLLLVLVRAAVATERLDEAREWSAELARHAEAMALPAGAVRGACAQAEILLATGDPAEAGRLAVGAAERAGRIGARRDELAARLLAGRALAAVGDRTEAVALLRAVTVDAARGGAFMWRDAAARELRRLGSRVSVENRRASGAESPRSLTARELDVARLVAEGRPNKAVAAALFLSEKTVEHHLSRVYAKFGVRSRAELTAVVAREGLAAAA
jgi:DNA-binding CsgD family transcriptional regulator